MESRQINLFGLERVYGLSRSAFRARVHRLGIKPDRRGRYSFISESEYQKLNELHRYLSKPDTKQTIDGFLRECTKGSEAKKISALEAEIAELKRRLSLVEAEIEVGRLAYLYSNGSTKNNSQE